MNQGTGFSGITRLLLFSTRIQYQPDSRPAKMYAEVYRRGGGFGRAINLPGGNGRYLLHILPPSTSSSAGSRPPIYVWLLFAPLRRSQIAAVSGVLLSLNTGCSSYAYSCALQRHL
jgi:hypothetical protein